MTVNGGDTLTAFITAALFGARGLAAPLCHTMNDSALMIKVCYQDTNDSEATVDC